MRSKGLKVLASSADNGSEGLAGVAGEDVSAARQVEAPLNRGYYRTMRSYKLKNYFQLQSSAEGTEKEP